MYLCILSEYYIRLQTYFSTVIISDQIWFYFTSARFRTRFTTTITQDANSHQINDLVAVTFFRDRGQEIKLRFPH